MPGEASLTTNQPLAFDPYQFAYRANPSTEDVIFITLHTMLSHLEHQGNYVGLLFIDFSLALILLFLTS